MWISLILLGTFVSAYFAGVVSKVFLVVLFLFCGIVQVFGHKKNTGTTLRIKLILSSILVVTIYLAIVSSSSYPFAESDWQELVSILLKLAIGPSLMIYLAFYNRTSPQKMAFFGFISLTAICLVLSAAKLANGVNTGLVLGNIHSNWMGFSGFALFVTSSLVGQGQRRLYRRLKSVGQTVAVVTVLISLSRGAMGGLLIFIVVEAFWRAGLLREKITKLYMPLALIILILITFNFSTFVHSEVGMYVSDFLERAFGKPLDTGRTSHWALALDWHSTSPIFGVGTEARSLWVRELANGTSIDLSPHNYYLVLLIEVGWVGLVAMLFYLLYLFRKITEIKNDKVAGIGSAAMIAILSHQIFEVSLTTGTFTLGIMMWSLLGIIFAHDIRNSSQIHSPANVNDLRTSRYRD